MPSRQDRTPSPSSSHAFRCSKKSSSPIAAPSPPACCARSNEMGIAPSRCIRKPTPARRIWRWPARRYAIGPAPARESYLDQDAAARSRAADRARTACTRATAFSPRTPSFAQRVERCRRALHRAVAAVDRGDGPQDAGARAGRALRHADVARAPDVLPARAGRDPRGRARDRLPGAGEAGGRRRRDRHAAREGRDASSSARSSARARWRAAASATPRSISSA